MIARKKRSAEELVSTLDDFFCARAECDRKGIQYSDDIEKAISIVEPVLSGKLRANINARWAALRILDGDGALIRELSDYCKEDIMSDGEVSGALLAADEYLREKGLWGELLKEEIASAFVLAAEDVCDGAITYGDVGYRNADRKLDRILTGRVTAYPVMLALLALVFWLTISGANYISQLISAPLFAFEEVILKALVGIGAPDWLCGVLVLGIYRVLASVISVMLPPMAIFFPMFTLLEDSGYLPRIAFNLDKPFCKCSACGKQALTMCMGFGCNAAGVVGCRIIDSPRERLLATVTNCFVPCNGKFPMMISLITIFFVGTSVGAWSSVLSALILSVVILLGISVTFFCTWLLSKTVLRGVPSSFTLELPPYRRPQVLKVLVRSVVDRTLFVLGRAVRVAAPSGLIIWCLANVTVQGQSLLSYACNALDPIAAPFGMDGTVLTAFILGLPAAEIVLPLILMGYTGGRVLTETTGSMRDILIANGWDIKRAVCVILFCLLHWPCATTLQTIAKETGNKRWAVLAAAIPTVVGLGLCFLINSLF